MKRVTMRDATQTDDETRYGVVRPTTKRVPRRARLQSVNIQFKGNRRQHPFGRSIPLRWRYFPSNALHPALMAPF
jgi:hypothetical protein